MNYGKQLWIILPLITIHIGFAGTLGVLHEYKTESNLIDVLVSINSTSVVPETYIYTDHFQNSKSPESAIAIYPPQKVVVSKNNKLLGIFQAEDRPETPGEPYNFAFSLYSSDTRLLYSLQDKAARELRQPSYFINDKQQAVVQVSANGDRLKFFDNHGSFLREKQLSQNVPHNYELPEIQFSEACDCMIFLTRMFNSESGKMIPLLYMLSLIGEELWQYQPILDRVEAISVSKSGKYIAISGATYKPLVFQAHYQTFIFDTSGTIRTSVPYRAHYLLFDPNEQNLLLANEQTIRIVNLKNGGVSMIKSLSSGQHEIADICFLNDSSFAVSSGTIKYINGLPVYDNPEIQVICLDGQSTAHYLFKNEYSFRGKLLPSLTGEQIGIALKSRFVVLHFHS